MIYIHKRVVYRMYLGPEARAEDDHHVGGAAARVEPHAGAEEGEELRHQGGEARAVCFCVVGMGHQLNGT